MAVYPDLTWPSGAPVLTIGVTGYRCNNFNVTEDTAQVDVTDNNGEFSGGVIFRGKTTFTAEIQVSTSVSVLATTVAVSTISGRFSYVYRGATVTGLITQAGTAYPQQGVWTQAISGQFQFN